MHITRKNPIQVPAPVGHYSHITIVPKEANWYILSGQVGTLADGTFEDTLMAQAITTFKHIKTVLATESLAASDIVKVNIWATEEIPWDLFDAEWHAFFGDSYPSMTIAYISALGLPELKIELDITAAK